MQTTKNSALLIFFSSSPIAAVIIERANSEFLLRLKLRPRRQKKILFRGPTL